MGVRRDEWTVGVADAQVDRVELGELTQWRASAFGTAHDRFLLRELCAIPVLDVHSDPPRNQVGPASHPVGTVTGLHPQMLRQSGRVLGLEVAGAVLESEHVAWCVLGRGG